MGVMEFAAPAARDIETITAEILEHKLQAGRSILRIGQCLIEAKETLSHGEWIPWLEERVEFSERAAQNFMRLAREYTNPHAVADLGARKALALLALPPAEREEFLTRAHVVDGQVKSVTDMTSRELEQAVKERDAALRQAETDRAERQAAEQARSKMEADLAFANERLAGLRQEVEEFKRRPADGAAESAAQAEELARLQKELEKAEQARRSAEEGLAAAREQLAARSPEPQAVIYGDKDLAQFAVYFEQAQAIANKMRGLLLKARSRADQTAAEKLEQALTALSDKIRGCAQ